MDKILKWSGIAVTILTILVGAVTGYAKLQGKVDVLNDKTAELKQTDSEQDKRLSDVDKAMAKSEANQEMILRILDKIDKKI